MRIDVKCKSDTLLPLDAFTEFQGNLKFRTVTDLDRITDSITTYGFSFPFFVWRDGDQNNIIDGHGRLEALRNLAAKGCEIPPLPVVYIKANSRDEAKNLLLRVNSLYGEIDKDELLALIAEAGASASDLSFPTVNLDEYMPYMENGEGDAGIFEPTLDPTIDTNEVTDKDIDRAEGKLADISKDKDFVKFICRDCGAEIFVKRESVVRYLKGEAV
ncbi:hypothetical protein FACS1894187_06940 [Synergistales bacterium]|nr:hypothetical protein FACS1894187_06940 [Synergistales bacterium]